MMHRAGITPWERRTIPEPLQRLTTGGSALTPGVALDLGCGTGRHAAYLAEHGWQVIGVDVSPAAIKVARRRSDRVRWQVADLQGPWLQGIGGSLAARVTLILDLGCLHGLSESGRRQWSLVVNDVAAPGATLLLWAIDSGHRPGPRGIAPLEIDAILGGRWSLRARSAAGWFNYERT